MEEGTRSSTQNTFGPDAKDQETPGGSETAFFWLRVVISHLLQVRACMHTCAYAFVLRQGLTMYISDWPGTLCVDKTHLEVIETPLPLPPQAWTTTAAVLVGRG